MNSNSLLVSLSACAIVSITALRPGDVVPAPRAALTATATASATSVVVGGSVTFTATPSGSGAYTYRWEFDDPASYMPDVVTQNPSHTFNWAGRHEVKVTITDPDTMEVVWVALQVMVEMSEDIEVVNAVEDIELDPTGGVNCSPVLQAYVDNNYAARGMRVLFPAGTYRFEEVAVGAKTHAFNQNNGTGAAIRKLEFVGQAGARPELVMYDDSGATGKIRFFRMGGANNGAPTSYLRVSNLEIRMELPVGSYGTLTQMLEGNDVLARNERVTIEDCSFTDWARVNFGTEVIIRRCNITECGSAAAEIIRQGDTGLCRQLYLSSLTDDHSHPFYCTSSEANYIVDCYIDCANSAVGRLAIQWKNAMDGCLIEGNLIRDGSNQGYSVMLGGYDEQCRNIDMLNNRFIGNNYTAWIKSCTGTVNIKGNFISYLDHPSSNNSPVFIIGHGGDLNEGGLNVEGLAFGGNVTGFDAPRGGGMVFQTIALPDPVPVPPTHPTWTYTTGTNADTGDKFLPTDPDGWHDTEGYLKPPAFDVLAPVVTSFAVNGGASTCYSASVTLNSSVSDSGSGMGSAERFPFAEGGAMQFANGSSPLEWGNVVPYSATHAWTLASGFGVRTVWVRYRDRDGNWTAAVSDTITRSASDGQ